MLEALFRHIRQNGTLVEKPKSRFGGIWSQDSWTLDFLAADLQDDGYMIVVRTQTNSWSVRQTGDFPPVYTDITPERFAAVAAEYL